jgi:hypothetical protein
MFRAPFAVAVCLGVALAAAAEAQTIGTFQWQLQPYCNIVTLTVTQNGPVYEMEGTDDQCGASQAASAVGTAFLNPDGSIGFGLNIVTAPGGAPVHVEASIGLSTLGGTWHDSLGATGPFVFTSGPGVGGNPRPAPSSAIPPSSVGSAQIDPAQVQLRIGGTCPSGSFMTGVGQTGSVICGSTGAPITAVNAGAGLESASGGSTVTVSLQTNASGAFRYANNSGFVAEGSFNSGNIPTQGPGTRAMWYPRKAAFRAGRVSTTQWNDANIGFESVAFGLNAIASGSQSVATGDSSIASGLQAVALGYFTKAAGQQSAALGNETIASGAHAFAMGNRSVASGGSSIAMGGLASATGFESVAMGLRVHAGGNGSVVLGTDAATTPTAPGTFIFADRSTTDDFAANLPNEFGVRAAGGVYLYSNSSLTTGCSLPAGSGTWACTSDRNSKERFEPVDGEMVLAKLRAMPISRWSYKSEPGVAHVGPVAQDFHDAFGLGGDDKTIAHLDLSGISLRAIQALETRTREHNETLMRQNDALQAEIVALRARLDRIEAKDQ